MRFKPFGFFLYICLFKNGYALKKILFIRFSSIGDIVLTTPVVRCVKKRMPDAELHFLTKSGYQSLLSSNPYINKVHALNGSLKGVIAQLKTENYDFIVDLHKNFRSVKVRMALWRPSASFPKLDFQKMLFTKLKIGRLPDVHVVDRYFKAVERLGVQNDGQGLDFFFHDGDGVEMETWPETFRRGFAAIVIGGQHATKILPADKVIEVCKELEYPVVLIGGSEDRERGEWIRKTVEKEIVNTCGQLSIGQSASLLQQAEVVLTNDTGMMHIAAALRKPIVSVWGNTVPQFGMYPYLPTCPERNCIIEKKGLKCRPCHKLGYEACPKGHFACMNTLDAKEIACRMREMMEK